MNLTTYWTRLRTIAFLEGWSFLLLLGIGMPLKYLAKIPEPNWIIGAAHGLLFVLFAVAVLEVAVRWPGRTLSQRLLFTLTGAFVSLIPGGTFWWDRRLKAYQAEDQAKISVTT
jgi:integral membrane protein